MMKWIHNFQLFLFDFDGLLVNTEHLHFAAYREMCRKRGYDLKWDFDRFCQAAHFDATGLQEAIYASFPRLKQQEPDWKVLYAEKKAAYQELLTKGDLHLMPGVKELLEELQKAGIKRCVVTNSTGEQIACIKERLPLLNTIPLWITREHYTQPKPSPECYLLALKKLHVAGDRAIGFEDSTRGLKALQGAGVRGVLICANSHPQMEEIAGSKTEHFESFEEISDLS